MTDSLYRQKNILTYKTRTTLAHAEASGVLSSFTLSLSRCDMTLSSLISSKRAAHFLMPPNTRQDAGLLLSDARHLFIVCVESLRSVSSLRMKMDGPH